MERSKFLSLNVPDFIKGAVVAVLTAVVTFVYEWIQGGSPLDLTILKPIGLTALAAFLGYIMKNFLTNSDGEILTMER